MAIKANGSAMKGLFGDAIKSLDPRKSMSKAKKNFIKGGKKSAMDLENVAGSIVKDGAYDKGKFGKYISEEDFADNAKRIGVSGELMDTSKKIAGRARELETGKGFSGNVMENLTMGAMGVKDYYTGNSSLSTKALRYGATAGALGTAAVAGRLANGGTLTRNSDGRKDIAGIPFI